MKASQPLRRRLLPLCMLPLLPTWAAPLWAQTAGEAQRVDDGEYRILHARYGTELSYVDVTPRLKELARRGRSFRLRTDTFGTDPAPGRVKKLLIFARGRDNQMRIFQYAEGAVVDGTRFADWNSADWGQGDAGGAGGAGGSGGPGSDAGEYLILHARYGSERRNVDITSRLKELARRDRNFRLGNATFGVDPDPGRPKTLSIFARGRDGQLRTFEYAEGAVVDGAQFSDWGSGGTGGQGGQGGSGGQGGQGGTGEPGAGSGPDAGEYLILSARYGSDRRNADVTPQLTELARRDRNFRLGAATFGIDPDPGRVKKLRIFTRGRNGQERVFEFSDGALIDGAQFAGWGSGNWGQGGGVWGGAPGNSQGGGVWGGAPGNNVPAPGDRLSIISATYGAAGLRRDITARLRARIRDNRLDVMVDNALAGGDPAPHLPKQLDLSYTLGSGRPQTLRVFEGERLRLP